MRRALLFAGVVGMVAEFAACAHDNPRPLPLPQTTVVCPPLKAYGLDQEKALAQALAAVPAGSPLVGAMADYGALRAAVRACKA